MGQPSWRETRSTPRAAQRAARRANGGSHPRSRARICATARRGARRRWHPQGSAASIVPTAFSLVQTGSRGPGSRPPGYGSAGGPRDGRARRRPRAATAGPAGLLGSCSCGRYLSCSLRAALRRRGRLVGAHPLRRLVGRRLDGAGLDGRVLSRPPRLRRSAPELRDDRQRVLGAQLALGPAPVLDVASAVARLGDLSTPEGRSGPRTPRVPSLATAASLSRVRMCLVDARRFRREVLRGSPVRPLPGPIAGCARLAVRFASHSVRDPLTLDAGRPSRSTAEASSLFPAPGSLRRRAPASTPADALDLRERFPPRHDRQHDRTVKLSPQAVPGAAARESDETGPLLASLAIRATAAQRMVGRAATEKGSSWKRVGPHERCRRSRGARPAFAHSLPDALSPRRRAWRATLLAAPALLSRHLRPEWGGRCSPPLWPGDLTRYIVIANRTFAGRNPLSRLL